MADPKTEQEGLASGGRSVSAPGFGLIDFATLPAGVTQEIIPLQAQDGGASRGVLYTRGGEKTVVCFMHPRADISRHYAMPALLEAGYATFGHQNRWLNNDIACIHEMLLVDIAAGVRFLKEVKGFQHVILFGNSGSGSLYGFYQAQAATAPPGRLTDTPAGLTTGYWLAARAVSRTVVGIPSPPLRERKEAITAKRCRMKSWIHFAKGQTPRQAHVGLGELKEDELGRQGFSGRVAELYHLHTPTAWTRIEGNLRPWDLDGYQLTPSDQSDPCGVPLPVFSNADVCIAISRRGQTMPYYVRNADGDEIYFVHKGTGTFETEFGPIAYEPGDYIVLPKGVTYRVAPTGPDNFFLVVESVKEIELPDYGVLGRHAPFDPTVLQVPEPQCYQSNGQQKEWEVRIKREGEHTSIFYPFHPLDVVGWKGDLFPFKMNVRDFRPITSDRLHLPPSVHCIFKSQGFVVCNFLPRPAEGEPDVERIPWYHRNIDYDEFVLVHAGKLLGAEVAPGTMLVNPQGIHHGLPEEFRQWVKANWRKDEYYDWQLINVDCERPLKITPEARAAARGGNQLYDSKA